MTHPPSDYDVVVIGGGPAGATVAGLLAAGGRHVALFEADRFPRHKLCGEFLSGEARSTLARLHVDADLVAAAAPITRARFTSPRGWALDVDLPDGGHGLRRSTLDAHLFARARDLGVHARDGTAVRDVVDVGNGTGNGTGRLRVLLAGDGAQESVHASLVVGAHGRRSTLTRQLGPAQAAGPPPWVAYQQHHVPRGRHGNALDGVVEVHGFPGGYCGINPVDGDGVNVCALIDGARLRAARVRRWPEVSAWMAGTSPALAARLDALEPVGEPAQVVAGTTPTRARGTATPALLLGDAAGMIAPLCGDGQAMALRGAELLAELILAGPGAPDADTRRRLAAQWNRCWQREFRTRLWVGRALQWLLLGEHTQRWTIGALARMPGLTRRLVQATRGASL